MNKKDFIRRHLKYIYIFFKSTQRCFMAPECQEALEIFTLLN